MKTDECAACMMYQYGPRNAMLLEACASVGISQGKTTEEMLAAFLREYHRRGHKER